MKPSLKISKQNSQILFAAMRQNLVAQKHVISHDEATIMLSVEFKVWGNYIIDAQCVMNQYEWANLMGELKPDVTIGTKSIPVDWYEMDRKQLISEMEDCVNDLIDKIEVFELEIIELE